VIAEGCTCGKRKLTKSNRMRVIKYSWVLGSPSLDRGTRDRVAPPPGY